MKVLNLKAVSVISLFIFVLLGVTRCNKHPEAEMSSLEKSKESKVVHVLEKPTPFLDRIILPVGTQWEKINDSEIVFTLPDDFRFLLVDSKSQTFRIDRVGGYRCDCSAGGGCIPFHNSELGFGCLHGNCSGTCEGKPTKGDEKYSIEGIIYIPNNELASEVPYKAQLTGLGKEWFFNIPEVKQEIVNSYQFLFKHIPFPHNMNVEQIIQSPDYDLVKVYMYGVEFAMVVPRDKNFEKYLGRIEKPTGCDCKSGDSGCEFRKAGMLGYKVYYCTEGCSSCELK